MLIVQVCDFGSDGDSEYRMHGPSRQMGQLPGITTIDCHFFHRRLPELTNSADVMVVQFVNNWDLFTLCQRRQSAGLTTVFEANDDFFDLQQWNAIAGPWKDRTVQELFMQLLVAADGVQTSSMELARRWRQCGAKEVAVFPNHLTEIEPLPDPPERPLTVGWGGSPGHFADWYQIVPLLKTWLLDHPEVHLAVMTNELAHSFVELGSERYHFTQFGSLQDYTRFLRTLDIGLAPLLDTAYNRGRSDVKYLEYASHGVVGIFTDLAPYHTSVVHQDTGFLASSPAEMIGYLELLRSNSDLRKRVRQNAYNYVKNERNLTERIRERVAWYRRLLKRSIAPTKGPSIIAQQAAASQEGGYIQLRPEKLERTLLDCMNPADLIDATTRLGEQLSLEPNYVAALVRQGQLLNDLRQHRQALQFLERAQTLAPDSVRAVCEIGRAWFCLNDVVRAREFLEQAIHSNPKYLPAWQYFLRFLSLTKASDGPVYARRVEELFTDCYPLTLIAIDVYPPAESLLVLTRVIERLESKLAKSERIVALGAVRKSIATAVQVSHNEVGLVPLLRRACRLFPESAWLASELGSALYRCGEANEAYVYQAKALKIQQQSAIFRDEFPNHEAIPWRWQFADHLCDHFPICF